MSFVHALLANPFLQYALLAGALASVACGVVGSYVVARRISYLAGGIAHCTLGGMGAARYFSEVYGLTWLHPLHGAIAAALAGALLIGVVSLRAKQREDTVISALWAIGMAVGILFIAATPGYESDLMSYLFGNILLVESDKLWLIVGLDVLVVGLGMLLYNKFLAVCFDSEFARLRGVNVEAYFLLLLCLTALTVVVLVNLVGLIMVIAMLTLPVAVAGQFCSRLWMIMIASAVINIALILVGMAVSFEPEWPPGATIIVLAGALYIVTLCSGRLWRRQRRPA